MKYKAKAYSIQEYGQRKDEAGNPHQEDSIFPLFGEESDKDRLFILCDGMGGHDSGEVASATVCEAMSKSILANTEPSGPFADEDLLKAIAQAYDALDAKDTGAAKKMGTTMTCLKLHQDGATIAHMGDSRVYHIRPGRTPEETQILHVTRDHSLVNDLIAIGELTPEEAKTSRQKNIITRAMQPHQDRRCKATIYHTADIQPGDYFYLCTDGMLEQMDDDQIKAIFTNDGTSDEQKRDRLVSMTADNKDNHTAQIIHITDVKGNGASTSAYTWATVVAVVAAIAALLLCLLK